MDGRSATADESASSETDGVLDSLGVSGFGGLVQLLTLGGVLLSVGGFEWLVNAFGRANVVVSTAPIGRGVGEVLIGISVLALVVVLTLAVVAWYRLPDPPA